MRCSLWMVGGSSYADATEADEFRSIAEARAHARAFWENDGFPATPCAQDVAFHFFRCPVAHISRLDPYPDEVWTMGPRGGLRRTVA